MLPGDAENFQVIPQTVGIHLAQDRGFAGKALMVALTVAPKESHREKLM